MKSNAYRFYFFHHKRAVIDLLNFYSFLFTVLLPQARADAILRHLLFRFQVPVLFDNPQYSQTCQLKLHLIFRFFEMITIHRVKNCLSKRRKIANYSKR